ncbi:MAG: MFS transporter [Deltaproteobacteria bacterium]|nr:MFS transporter [Deltaproteobacteria bacterium]
MDGERAEAVTNAGNAPRRFFGLPRAVFLLGAVSFMNDAASEMIYPLMPVFLASIGASMSFIGLVEGVAETTASLLKLFSGCIADRLGRKRALTVAGYAFSNALRPLIGIASAGWHVLFLRFVDRVGKGIRTAPRDAVIADATPEGERGRAYGFNRSMDHGGAMVGAAVAFVLLTYAGVSVPGIFLLSAVPGILAVVFVTAAVGTARDPSVRLAAPPKLSLRPFSGRFRLFLFVLVVFTLGNSSDAFLLLRARELGVPVAHLPLVWIMFHAVKSISSGPGGALSDRVGRTRMIVAGWLVYALVYLGFSQAQTAAHAWVLFACYGLFFGLTEGVEKAFVADLVPAELRGTAFGIYNFAIGIVALPASLLCGFLWQSYSSTVALGTGAALAAVASVLLVAAVRSRTSDR